MKKLFGEKKNQSGFGSVPSPCTDLCSINPETELCEGCYRTIDEIAEWSHYSDQEKLEILSAIKKRKAYHNRSK